MMNYDKKKKYEENVAPVVAELKRVCTENGIPVFVTVCVENTDGNSIYESDMISPTMLKLDLAEDHFPKHLGVVNGFDVAPFKKDIEELELPIV